MKLFEPFSICSTPLKNRLVLAPVVCFGWAGVDGMVTPKHIDHYRRRARGGAGLVVLESTAILSEGRGFPRQLGIWSDEQIPGMAAIASACRESGAASILQLQHGGLTCPPEVTPIPLGPSADPERPASREMTLWEIDEIRRAFVAAARRAKKAGFDGVELHGAHGFLLCQFADGAVNHRRDGYGGTEGRVRLMAELLEDVKSACGGDFIVGCRFGANVPTLEEGVEQAAALDRKGMDYFSVSTGGGTGIKPQTPPDSPYNWVVWSAKKIKEAVKAPVIGVNRIRTPERAEFLLEQGWMDLAAIGREFLAEPDWGVKAEKRVALNPCLQCASCRWLVNGDSCPALKKLGGQQK